MFRSGSQRPRYETDVRMVDKRSPSASRPAMISRMSSATSVFLVARRHVDFGRVRSMICQPA